MRTGSHQGTEPRTKNFELRTLCLAFALLALAAPATARFNNPTLLFDTPTADVLPVCDLAISADMTYPLVQTPKNANYLEADVNLLFSPVKGLDIGLTGYTFTDYVLDVKYQILGGGDPGKFGLAVGVYDIGLNEYVSPIGHGLDGAWPDWEYNAYLPRYNRPTERFSAYAVTSIPVAKFARLHLGLGRGRFVGYDDRSKYLNSDIFFDEYHQWAVAVFGGVEVYVHPKVALVAEASSRDLNTGVKANFGPISAAVAWTKMEGLLFGEGEDRFGRLDIGVAYQFNNACSTLARLIPRRECAPMEPVPPPPEPVEVPVGPDPTEREYILEPIHFDLDESDIRPGDAEILNRNAATILAKAKVGLKADVIIEGHTCPYASEMYNVGLGMRRAESAKSYLVGLGVDSTLLTTETFGELNPPYRDTAEYYLDRRDEFRWRE